MLFRSNDLFLTEQVRFTNPSIKHITSSVFRPYKIIPTDNIDGIQIIEAKDLYQESEFVCAEICRLVKECDYKFNEISIVSRYPEEYSGIFETCFNRYNIPYFMDIDKSVMHTSIMLLITSVLDIISFAKPDTETILKFAKTQLLGIRRSEERRVGKEC